MTPEERDELIHFILQSQANAATEHEETRKQMAELRTESRENTQQIKALAAVSHDLVEIARRHSRRIDGLEGLNPEP